MYVCVCAHVYVVLKSPPNYRRVRVLSARDRLFRPFQHEAGKTKCLVSARGFLQWLKENQEEEAGEEEEEEEGSD